MATSSGGSSGSSSSAGIAPQVHAREGHAELPLAMTIAQLLGEFGEGGEDIFNSLGLDMDVEDAGVKKDPSPWPWPP